MGCVTAYCEEKIATHWTLEEGRGVITGGKKGDEIHESGHSIQTSNKSGFCSINLHYFFELDNASKLSLSNCYISDKRIFSVPLQYQVGVFSS